MARPSNNPELFQAFRNGDRTALGVYYQLHYDSIFRFLRNQTRNEALAEDLTADVFCVLITNRLEVVSEGHLLGFLFITANHLLCANFRKRLRDDKLKVELSYLTGSEIPFYDEKAHSAESLSQLRHSFLRLTARRKRILVLHYFHGYSTGEIAERLNISEQTVRNHLSQTLDKLRDSLLGRWGGKNPLFS